MPNNVKDMLDSIINNTDNSYQKNDKGPAFKANTVGATVTSNNFHPQTFDSGKFKEKLSLYVLHDLVDAMMVIFVLHVIVSSLLYWLELFRKLMT